MFGIFITVPFTPPHYRKVSDNLFLPKIKHFAGRNAAEGALPFWGAQLDPSGGFFRRWKGQKRAPKMLFSGKNPLVEKGRSCWRFRSGCLQRGRRVTPALFVSRLALSAGKTLIPIRSRPNASSERQREPHCQAHGGIYGLPGRCRSCSRMRPRAGRRRALLLLLLLLLLLCAGAGGRRGRAGAFGAASRGGGRSAGGSARGSKVAGAIAAGAAAGYGMGLLGRPRPARLGPGVLGARAAAGGFQAPEGARSHRSGTARSPDGATAPLLLLCVAGGALLR